MNNELQYDSSLGGANDLDDRINLLRFTSARAKEIYTMKQALNCSTSVKQAFQRLPKHMRRRVMSHNAKRLPRRLREIHLSQLKKSGMPPKQKRPTRKYRRRPSNLLNDYIRRQQNHTWLETHIWHAKRFHMISKWGYRLPDRPCDKAFRACYRATSKHCLVQDVSYFNCIEISGKAAILMGKLKTVCDCNIGLSIGAKAYIRGNREGKVVLFHHSGIKKAIGTVYFHWKPITGNEDESVRTLWIWAHTAYYSEVLNMLVGNFNLKFYEEHGAYINNTLEVQLTEMKYNLNRFRLTGPLSLSILNNVLKVPDVTSANSNLNCSWFQNYLVHTTSRHIFTKQCEYWENIKNVTSAELSPHTIVSLTVTDPRFNLPKTKTKAVLNGHSLPKNLEVPENVAFGPIWDTEIRSSVKENKISNEKIAEMRSQLLVPGSEIENTKQLVPVMVIQRPGDGDQRLGCSSGWDLIVPSGWGNTFWMSLIMWGGRAGGLREFDSVRFESGQPPFLAPDTKAGIEEEHAIAETHRHRFFSLPPNKRPNYIKFGTIQPFNFNWKTLIHEWSSLHIEEFFVLRDKNILTKIKEMLLNKAKFSGKLQEYYNMNCIIPVRIKLEKKGTIKQFARIFLPNANDLLLKEPIEPLRSDSNQESRKQLRLNHKNLLKRLKQRRKKSKGTEKTKSVNVEILQKYKEQMRKLWLPDLNQDIRTLCTRQTIGFVTSGGFSFIQAHSCGIGYIAMGAIKALELCSHKTKVLVRNIASRQYRIATVEVIV